MKIRLLLTGVMLAFAFMAYSQTVTPDERLLVRYDKEYLQDLSVNAPQTLALLNYSLDNAWFVTEDMDEKYASLPELCYVDVQTGEKTLSPVVRFDAASFNVFSCFFEQGLNNRTYYRIGNTGKVVVFYSLTELAEMYNNGKGGSHE